MITYDSKAASDIERSYLTPEIVRQRMQTLEALALRAGERVLEEFKRECDAVPDGDDRPALCPDAYWRCQGRVVFYQKQF